MVECLHTCLAHAPFGLDEHIADHLPNGVADEGTLLLLDREPRMTRLDAIPKLPDQRELN